MDHQTLFRARGTSSDQERTGCAKKCFHCGVTIEYNKILYLLNIIALVKFNLVLKNDLMHIRRQRYGTNATRRPGAAAGRGRGVESQIKFEVIQAYYNSWYVCMYSQGSLLAAGCGYLRPCRPAAVSGGRTPGRASARSSARPHPITMEFTRVSGLEFGYCPVPYLKSIKSISDHNIRLETFSPQLP